MAGDATDARIDPLHGASSAPITDPELARAGEDDEEMFAPAKGKKKKKKGGLAAVKARGSRSSPARARR